VTLLGLVLQVAAVVALLHALGLSAVVQVGDHRAAARSARRNVRAVAPTAGVLAGVLAVNRIVREVGVELSWLIGVNITADIHAVEGGFVAAVQSLATPSLTAYFSFVYVFGYVFLLTFPLVLYALHDDERPLRTTLVAYVLNYLLGLACYVAFVAYGPRNFMPDLVNSLLFANWPQSQLLTSQVNENTNVFPSLHASLSVTVAALAYRFRGASPRWVPLAGFLAASVVVSTMYLGIHWLTDVVAGVALGVASVAAASWACRLPEERDEWGWVNGLTAHVVHRLRGFP
jgi:membrane-associated phospholipid phosphatase